MDSTEKSVIEPAPQKHRKDKADTTQRFRDLLAQLTTAKQQLAERTQEVESLRADLRAKDRARAQVESEREQLPALVARARDKGRKIFPDFDAVIGPVQLDQKTFEGLLTHPHGVELMYAMGLGLRIIAARIEKQNFDSRAEYYRQQHQQHFKGAS